MAVLRYTLFINWNKPINQIYYIQMDSMLDHEPFMVDLQQIMKPAYYAQLRDAIMKEDITLIWELLSKYLRKNEVQKFFTKIISLKPYLNDPEHMRWKTITGYLRNRLTFQEYQMIQKLIITKDIKACKTLLESYLRFDQANELLSHIQKYNQWSTNQQVGKISHTETPRNTETPGNTETPRNTEKPELKLEQNKTIHQGDKFNKQYVKQYENVSLSPNNKQQLYFSNNINPELKSLSENIPRNPNRQQKIFHPLINNDDIYKQRKASILEQIYKLFEKEDKQQFYKIKESLQQGIFQKVKVVLDSLVGFRKSEKYVKQLKQLYPRIKNYPIQSSFKLMNFNDNITLYKLPFQLPLDKIYKSSKEDEKTINVLIIGGTGVGKSTYLNALGNFLMGVEMEDDFRYVLNEDFLQGMREGSTTQKVKVYQLPMNPHTNSKVRLIDTPGIGNSGGPEKDKNYINNIKNAIGQKVRTLNLIIYIFKANQTRLITQKQYIVKQIMKYFTINISPSVLFIFSFADNMEPLIKPIIEAKFNDIIRDIKADYNTNQWYLKTNNSSFFKTIEQNNVNDVSFYMMGTECLKKTVVRMVASPKDSIIQPHEKLRQDKRQKEKDNSVVQIIDVAENRMQKKQKKEIQQLTQELKKGIQKQTKLRKIIEKLSKNVYYKYDFIVDIQSIFKNKIQIVRMCPKCYRTFTNYLQTSNTNQRQIQLIVMNNTEEMKCSQKCKQKLKSSYKILQTIRFSRDIKLSQLMFKYQISDNSKSRIQNLILKFIQEYFDGIKINRKRCDTLFKENSEIYIGKSLLKPRTINEYIGIMIDNQYIKKKPEERLKEYRILQDYGQKMLHMTSQTIKAQLIRNLIKEDTIVETIQNMYMGKSKNQK